MLSSFPLLVKCGRAIARQVSEKRNYYFGLADKNVFIELVRADIKLIAKKNRVTQR